MSGSCVQHTTGHLNDEPFVVKGFCGRVQQFLVGNHVTVGIEFSSEITASFVDSFENSLRPLSSGWTALG